MRLRSHLAAAVLAAACALAPLRSAAEEPAKPGAAPAEQPVCGRDLMTPEERSAHREKLRSLAPEARAAYRAEHHAKMVARAKERGVELAPAGCPVGQGMGGGGMGMGPGGGAPGPGPGPGPRQP